LCFLIDFIDKHNPSLIKNIDFPCFENINSKLILANHSLKQLNMISDQRHNGKLGCVANFLNNCITNAGKRKFNYDLLDDFLNVDKDEIRIDEVKASDKQTDQITFYLRDKLSDKILLFSSSSYFTESYGSRDKYANILNLLWSRAINNILIYLNFRSFNSNLALLESCIDFIGVSSTSQNSNAKSGSSIDVEFLDSSSSDVEFIN
jgi:DNA mismatch repair ATPase MutS